MRAELEMLRAEARRLEDEKERMMDELLRREFGDESDNMINEPTLPADGTVPPWLLQSANGDPGRSP